MEEAITTLKVLPSVLHMIGFDEFLVFRKNGKRHFRPYRNYYTVGIEGTPYLDALVEAGYARAAKDGDCMVYHLMESGFKWIEESLRIVIHSKGRLESEELPELDDYEKSEIENVWKWVKEHNIYSARLREEFDVALYFDIDEDFAEFSKEFAEEFCTCQSPLPVEIFNGMARVKFSYLIPFEVSAEQIWALRPDGMRDDW